MPTLTSLRLFVVAAFAVCTFGSSAHGSGLQLLQAIFALCTLCSAEPEDWNFARIVITARTRNNRPM